MQDRANPVQPCRAFVRLSFLRQVLAACLASGGASATEPTPHDTEWWIRAIFAEQQLKVAVDQSDHQRAALVAGFLRYSTDYDIAGGRKPSEPCFHAAMELRVAAGSASHALTPGDPDPKKLLPSDAVTARSLLDESYADFVQHIRECEALIKADATSRAWSGRPSGGLR
ncbi:MAG TPA: hypothetical protein VH743_17250 [Beijerinckiaceae bacterium]